ncbi:hypothetical protein RHMOL_Rhmol11G0124800 [Rhododendron molle]|nr:hypothetical protein RHMOL_Rhmol11G0124800 [Rhododendron molle]
MHSIVLHTFKLSNCASNGLDLISTMNSSQSLVTEMRSEPSDARSDCSKMRSTVLYISLHSINPKSPSHSTCPFW